MIGADFCVEGPFRQTQHGLAPGADVWCLAWAVDRNGRKGRGPCAGLPRRHPEVPSAISFQFSLPLWLVGRARPLWVPPFSLLARSRPCNKTTFAPSSHSFKPSCTSSLHLFHVEKRHSSSLLLCIAAVQHVAGTRKCALIFSARSLKRESLQLQATFTSHPHSFNQLGFISQRVKSHVAPLALFVCFSPSTTISLCWTFGRPRLDGKPRHRPSTHTFPSEPPTRNHRPGPEIRLRD